MANKTPWQVPRVDRSSADRFVKVPEPTNGDGSGLYPLGGTRAAKGTDVRSFVRVWAIKWGNFVCDPQEVAGCSRQANKCVMNRPQGRVVGACR